jgi:accessory gene regulator B
MVKKLSNRITSYLIRKNIIEAVDAEIYQYGMKHIIINMTTLLIVSLLATVLHTWVATIFFFVGFMPIRLIAGGYHAKTPFRCNMLSLVIYSFNIIIVYSIYEYMTELITISTGVIIILIIFAFAPVDHKNRTLEVEEYQLAKKKSRITGLVITGGCILFGLLYEPDTIFITGTLMGSLTASISLIIGKIKRGGERNEEIKQHN